jgi:hypothetical protein
LALFFSFNVLPSSNCPSFSQETLNY